MNFIKYNWPSITWAAFILVVCLMPGKDLPSINLWQFDKLEHMGVYIILAALTYWGWRRQTEYGWFHKHTFMKILIIAAVYGFAVEVMQKLFTTDRQFDLLDATANALGACIGSLISVKLFK